MLRFVNTSLLESRAQTVVNTVNTVGVMGKGLAAEFKQRSPDMFKQYKYWCEQNQLDVGKLWLWKRTSQWILNFPTKRHWRNPSKLEYIEAGLRKFVATYEEQGITEISFPRLGCGNGGLDWEEVRPLMEKYLGPLPILVFIHDYVADIGAPEHNAPSVKVEFKASFDSFEDDLEKLITLRNGEFRTIKDQHPFAARFDSDKSLAILPTDTTQEILIAEDDLFEAWQMLMHGPLTKEQLVGAAYTSASYLLGVLATLPYARAIEIRPSDGLAKEGVELLVNFAVEDTLEAKQQEALWA